MDRDLFVRESFGRSPTDLLSTFRGENEISDLFDEESRLTRGSWIEKFLLKVVRSFGLSAIFG